MSGGVGFCVPSKTVGVIRSGVQDMTSVLPVILTDAVYPDYI